eukprot:jgi/Botrbrau1/23010/Bobra.136_1s0002.1
MSRVPCRSLCINNHKSHHPRLAETCARLCLGPTANIKFVWRKSLREVPRLAKLPSLEVFGECDDTPPPPPRPFSYQRSIPQNLCTSNGNSSYVGQALEELEMTPDKQNWLELRVGSSLTTQDMMQ